MIRTLLAAILVAGGCESRSHSKMASLLAREVMVELISIYLCMMTMQGMAVLLSERSGVP